MNIRNVSLITVGIIWIMVGLFLSLRGMNWILQLGMSSKLIIFLSLATVVGLLKGKFVLRKVALKYYKRGENIEYNKTDIFTGWIKILGLKGAFLIALMVIMGILLRHSSIDRSILGIIYLAVGIALLYASKVFFMTKDYAK